MPDLKSSRAISTQSHNPREPLLMPLRYTLDDVYTRSSEAHFTVVSTFAGGGGSSTGYRLAGGKVIFVNEFVDQAVNTYRKNYPDTPVESASIRTFNHGRADVERLFAKHGIMKGQLDVLDGSPPCSTFSTASGGKGEAKMLAKGVKYSDTTQDRVGMLIHDFVFMANVMQPKVCIIENVPSIKSADVFADSLERLRRNGYLVAHKVLVASDYGAPQKRKRLIVIATRQDIARAAKIENEEALQDAFPKPTVTQPITVREALDGIVNDAAEREMLLSKARRGSEYEFMRLLPHAPSKPIRLSDVAPSLGSNFLLTRASWDHPSSTITATGAGGRGGVLHPVEDRPFTVAELKRITGLPDDFKLTGTFLQKAERVGRMVPPPLSMAVGFSVFDRVLAPRWHR